jgi:hypothetical protein
MSAGLSMQIFVRFLTASLLLLTAACLPVTSKSPVGSTVGFKPDKLLFGTWKARDADGDAPSYVHILGNEDGTMTALIVTSPRNDNPGDWSTYTLRAATLGTNAIVNAQESIANRKPSEGPLVKASVVLLYRATGAKQVTLYQMDDKAVAGAIRGGEIVGEIEPGENGDVRITAGEPALDAFMKTPRAARLFVKPLVTLTRAD